MTRTTVTLDADVEQLLRDAMQRRRRSFKETLNQAIRRGLADRQPGVSEPAFVVHAHPMGGVRPGVDPLRLNQMADELEADAFMASTAHLADAGTPRRHRRK